MRKQLLVYVLSDHFHILVLHSCSVEAYVSSNQVSCSLAGIPVWKRPDLLKSTWRKRSGLLSRHVWLGEILENLGTNQVLEMQCSQSTMWSKKMANVLWTKVMYVCVWEVFLQSQIPLSLFFPLLLALSQPDVTSDCPLCCSSQIHHHIHYSVRTVAVLTH